MTICEGIVGDFDFVDRAFGFEEGMEREGGFRPEVVPGAHFDVVFLGGMLKIVPEGGSEYNGLRGQAMNKYMMHCTRICFEEEKCERKLNLYERDSI
jgi:hypothetical protein